MKRGFKTGILLVLLFIGVCVAVASAQGTQFTINATAGQYGNISPSGDVQVAQGTNQTFVITPDPKQVNCFGSGKFFVVWNLTVDGQLVDIGSPSSQPVNYTFTDVETNHTIHAEFALGFINAKPTVQIMADPVSGKAPLPVNFSYTSSTNFSSVLWSFGDNSTSTETNPQHTYPAPGQYTVRLTLYCEDTPSWTVEAPDLVSVLVPPVANFTSNTTTGFRPLTVQFNDTSTGSPPLNYSWDFGDNTFSTEQNPVHTYTSAGTYPVNLTVSNSVGNDTKSADQPITVLGPIGGNKGYFLVHCNVDGAKVFFDADFKGLIANGTLNVSVFTTASPYRSYTVSKDGYATYMAPITQYPGKDQTIDLYAVLTPSAARVTGWVASGTDYGPFSVAGARVRFAKNASDLASPYTSREATTDARGIYAISGLPTGVPLYADVLSPVNFPDRYYTRPLSFQVNGGSLVTAWNTTSFPRIPALVRNQTTQVNFFLKQNPNGLSNTVIIG
jgi:PKD repeat protein